MKPFDPWKFLPFWREILIFGVSIWTGLWAWLRVRQAQSWPTTQATILAVSARRAGPHSYFYPWVAVLTYSYIVNGEYYSGTTLLKARSERRAEEMIAGWKNRMIVLRHSPTNHEISVALKSDQPGGQLGNAT